MSRCLGSSPRMRGKPHRRLYNDVAARLIPAHAGKTTALTATRIGLKAHPRACGENLEWFRVPRRVTGSSPRMRGKLRDCRRPPRNLRLIPAHAGKTDYVPKSLCRSGAHPRACGENILKQCSWTTCAGSSPRMRGKLSSVRSLWNVRGLIPAHAGKTSRQPLRHTPWRAHPRACGENRPWKTDA